MAIFKEDSKNLLRKQKSSKVKIRTVTLRQTRKTAVHCDFGRGRKGEGTPLTEDWDHSSQLSPSANKNG